MKEDQPAFPCNFDTIDALIKFQGMSMRQYYKAAALQGLLADSANMSTTEKNVAMCAIYADLMLAEDAQYEKGKK